MLPHDFDRPTVYRFLCMHKVRVRFRARLWSLPLPSDDEDDAEVAGPCLWTPPSLDPPVRRRCVFLDHWCSSCLREACEELRERFVELTKMAAREPQKNLDQAIDDVEYIFENLFWMLDYNCLLGC